MELDTTVHGSTELRVHGVSGTPPEEMLAHPAELIREVGGDSRAGFWRRWYPGGTTHDQPDVRHLEAYSWGGLTSGPASRALWLVLLPFTLVNLAHWMLPTHAKDDRPSRLGLLAVTVLRLIGLSFTLTLTVATTLATADVAGWQCGALPACARRLGPFAFVGNLQPGPRVALGAAVPALLVIVLWWLGRTELRPTRPTRPPRPAVAVGEVPLAAESFWAGDRSTIRLRAVHVTAWCGALGALTLGPALRYGNPGLPRATAWVLVVVDLVLLVAALAATLSNAATGRGGAGADRLTTPLVLTRWAAVAAMVASLAAVAFLPAHYPPPPTHLPVLRVAVLTLVVGQLLLLAVLFACVSAQSPWRAGADRPGYRTAVRGLAAPVVALLGWLVAGAFSAGAGLWLTDYLGDPVTSTGTAISRLDGLRELLTNASKPLSDRVDAVTADRPLIVPPAYFWAGTAALVTLVLAIVVLVVVAFRVRAAARRSAVAVAAEHPGEQAPGRAATVGRVRALAALTDSAGAVLSTLVGIATIVVVAGMATYVVGGYAVVERPGLSRVTDLGVATIAFVAAGLVGLAFWAFRDRRVRRYVGILWDVATFWPRANHPLTPPCYGERAVPELAERVGALATGAADRVVLSGHSQGSVLVTAVALQLSPEDAGRTILLTYGCPVRRLYARYFPAYFGGPAIDAAAAAVGDRWLTLWVPSDPIGSWVVSGTGAPGVVDGRDERLADPVSLVPGPDGRTPAICGHSGFLGRPEYGIALDRLLSSST